MASILSELGPVPGSTVNSTRLGRGPGNKKGKTSGRGTKGHNARSGGKNAFFEGGQTPIHIRFPKIGHRAAYLYFCFALFGWYILFRRLKMTPVNLDRIQEAINEGKMDPNQPITMKTLKDAKVVNKIEDGVKLLARVDSFQVFLLNFLGKEYIETAYRNIRLTGF
jgi:large subunit ribosomal protein L15